MPIVNAPAGVRHLGGWIPDRPDHRDRLLSVALGAPGFLPLPTEARVERDLGPVYDQGQIGSCVANALAAALTAVRPVEAAPFAPSRLYLYYRGRQWDGLDVAWDGGMTIRGAVKALEDAGACSEERWPYLDDGEAFARDPGSGADEEAELHQALLALRCATLDTVRASIRDGFPVVLGFSVPANMMGWAAAATGMVFPPGPDEAIVGGHAVLAYAYDEAAVRCRNSWGATWGDGGDVLLPVEFWQRQLVGDAWTLRRAEVG